MCFGFRLPYWKKGRTGLWHPPYSHLGIAEEGVDDLVEFFNWIIGGGHVAAHNAFFDRGIWQNQAVVHHGWPAIPLRHWHCTAARAAAHALPRSVENAGAALGLKVVKDKVGHKTMLKVSKPRKPRKKEVQEWTAQHGATPMPVLYHESKELFETLWAYCRQDVLAEQEISQAVPDLSEQEQELYWLDQTINERGFLLDMEAVTVALELIDQETTRLNGELRVLTGGNPDKATQRSKMHKWLLDRWIILDDTRAGTVDEALQRDDLTPEGRRGLELLQALSRSSTAKYQAAANWACPDGRIRGGLLYHAASTGRWGGQGFQPHNLVRSTVKDMDGAWAVLKSGDRAAIEAFDAGKEAA